MKEDFAKCENADYVGVFQKKYLTKTGLRVPPSRYHDSSARPAATEYIPAAILGNRLYEGKDQYEVQWEGYEDTTWHDADKLTCYELIEQYELNKEIP
jgi:hypothetical protein